MALVKRANCERIVPDEKVNEFLSLGYSLIDKDGTVLKKGKAQSKEDLLVAYKDVQKENEEFQAEIVRLKTENDSLKAEIEALKKGADDKFKCPHCDKEYATQAALDKHIKEKHPETLNTDGANSPE